MPAASTAKKVQYDLRPSKQIERRLFVEILNCGAQVGFPVADCTYVGMGGFKFYDFVMFHRYLNITKMFSVEGDPDLLNRCDFNKPYGFIEIVPDKFGSYMKAFSSGEPHIFWVDYDQGIQKDIAADMVDLAAKISSPSFLFVSIKADPGGPYRREKTQDRLKRVQKDFPTLSRSLREIDLSEDHFRWTSMDLLKKMIGSAFSGRKEPLTHITSIMYRDGANMATRCYVFGEEKFARAVLRKVKAHLPFLILAPEQPAFMIPEVNISEVERRLLDRISTSHTPDGGALKMLKSIGFSDEDISAYRAIYRYIPRYIETYV